MVAIFLFAGVVALLLPVTLITNIQFWTRLRNEYPEVWQNARRPFGFGRFLYSSEGLQALPDPSMRRLGKAVIWLQVAILPAWVLFMYAAYQLSQLNR